MKSKKIKNGIFVLFIFGSIYFQSLQGQNANNRWAVGMGAGGTLYSKNDLRRIGYRFSEQFPRLSIARYMFKNVTFAGQFSQSLFENKKYTSLDAEIRYDFGTSENTIMIYALVGGSLIDTKYLLPLMNFGIGGTLWILEDFGLKGQLIYKYNHLGFQSQASHIFGSGGIVYRFEFGKRKKNRNSKQTRTRLWEMKH